MAKADAVGHILLAAGASRRLGRPKQLVEFQGEPLLRRTARVALAAARGPVVVVLGAAATECARTLEGLPVEVVEAGRWAEGMGASLAAGMKHLETRFSCLSMLGVLLCDQWRVDVAELEALQRALGGEEKSIAASLDGAWVGPPAYFRPRWFPQLARMEGERGARSLISRHPDEVAIVRLPGMADDVDEPADLARMSEIRGPDYNFDVRSRSDPAKGVG